MVGGTRMQVVVMVDEGVTVGSIHGNRWVDNASGRQEDTCRHEERG